MKNQKRNYKNYIIPIVLSILVLTIIGVYAGVTLSNSPTAYLSADNLTINGSGAYLQNGANLNGVSSGTADVVVCRGTSTWDDYYKSNKLMSGCDILCPSTASNCGTYLDTAIGSGNVNLFISKGVYPITSQIHKISKSNVYIKGDGVDNTILSNSYNGDIFLLNDCNRWTISDLTINGSLSQTSATLIHMQTNGGTDINLNNIKTTNLFSLGLYEAKCINCGIYNSRFMNTNQSGNVGFAFYNSKDLNIRNNIFDNFSQSPLYFNGDSGPNDRVSIISNSISNVGTNFYNAFSFGMYLRGVYNSVISQNKVYNTNGSAILVFDGARNNLVSDNWINNTSIGLDIGDGATDTNNFIGNYIGNSMYSGIFVGNTFNNLVSSNIIVNPNTLNIPSYGSDGIRMGGDTATYWNQITNNFIVDTRSTPLMEYCISDQAIAPNTAVNWNNTFSGNTCKNYGINNMIIGNTSYSNDYTYSGAITLFSCSTNNVMDEKIIRNSTTTALCHAGVWTIINPGLNTSVFNSTQMNYSGGNINILTSWLTTFVNSFNFLTYLNLTNMGNNSINGTMNITTSKDIQGNTIIATNKYTFVDSSGSSGQYVVSGGNAYIDSPGTLNFRTSGGATEATLNSSGSFALNSGSLFCLDATCTHYLIYNGTCIKAVGSENTGNCI